MPDFTKTPAYQRSLQRLRRMSPEQRAVFSSLSLSKSFADKEMRKKVRSMNLAADKEARQASLELGERRLGLRTREHEFAKKQILPATLIGLGQVGLGVATGLERRKTAQEMARLNLSLQSQYTPTGTLEQPAPRIPRSYGGGRPRTPSAPTMGWARRPIPRRTRPYWGQ